MATTRTVSACATVLLAAALLTGCDRAIEGATAVAGPDLLAAAKTGELKCTTVDAPLTQIERVDADEPTLMIPVPSGWNRLTGQDGDLLRFRMVNRDIPSVNAVPASAVAALESVGGSMEPDDIFDAERASLVNVGVSEATMKITDHEVCGLPAQTVDYEVPASDVAAAHPGVVLFVAYKTDVRTYCAGVTVQGTEPDNPTFQRDRDQIINGFQVFKPSSK